ncbi:glucosaminidase domain-containing protein [Hyalangium rubrum]|uniref:Peptidoglycan hydrolase n=1 Tax=Hyalangium rubrum TaxID=3103134 RepID=A0ABU5HGY6_9BACT|nr:glucosaminidase domain-containing protein [Hyalangium sp. s54d21]MDY7231355.1 glucosaminidase domain-containing protein [Hyalangium sp. s54d21]
MNTYSVRKGDTLNELAKRFGTSAKEIAKKNGLEDINKIQVGQKLIMPDSFEQGTRTGSTNSGTSSKPSPEASAPATTAAKSGPAKDDDGRQFPTSRDGTPIYKQGDAQWGGRTLGSSSSLAAAGCAMTSTAMAISKITGKVINPGELDQYLDKNGGYSGNGLIWGKAAQMAGLGASKPGWSFDNINKQIDAGRPVVIGVDYKAGSNGGANGTDHWITVTGRGTQNGKPVYYANDPATGKEITLTKDGNRLTGGPQGYKSTGELVTFSGGNPNPGTAPTNSQPGGETPTQTPPASSVDMKGTTLPGGELKKGARGPEVEQLQNALVKSGHLTQADMSTGPGIFGPKTEAALKKFQADNGVDAIGIYGPKTRAAFEKLGAKIGGGSSTPTNPTGPTTPVGDLPKTGNAFLDRVAADAIKSQRQTGVPASVTLAQAMLESGSGQSGLATKANNFFGIKGEGPAGHVTMPTKEFLNGKWVTVNANFRKYNSPAESFADHGKFLRDNRRYANAFNHTDNAAQFAREIHKAGYATDPEYSNKLISIINKYGLDRFDKIARG